MDVKLTPEEYFNENGRYKINHVINVESIEEVRDYLCETKADKEYKKLTNAYIQLLDFVHGHGYDY